MRIWILLFGLAVLAGLAAPATAPSFSNEQLHYTINWPSGLSLGEASLRGTRVNPTPKSAQRLDFEFTIDAGVPGFQVTDKYHSADSPDLCSIEFDRQALHGKKKTDEKTVFDQEKGTATRETTHGGKSDLKTPSCAKDALDFLYYVRRELSQGRLPAPQEVFFGAAYNVRLEFAGTQIIKVADQSVEADRLNATLKGPASDIHFEIYFLKDAARTPALVRVPLSMGMFSMELVK